MRRLRRVRMALTGSVLLLWSPAALAEHGGDWHVVERVSVASDGTQANGYSGSFPSVSGDGRVIAFDWSAGNLVPGDTNEAQDVFVHDRVTGRTERVSVADDGGEANGDSGAPSVSGDGRVVAFGSSADNLVSGDTNRAGDVFVHDRVTGRTERVSVASDGTQANRRSESHSPSVGGDGRVVAFWSDADNLVSGDTNNSPDVFVHDRVTGRTERVSVASDGTQANSYSWGPPSISGDGRVVAFGSYANNLVPGDTNNSPDVFVHDRVTSRTERVSVATDGTQANRRSESLYPSLSGDGRTVAFGSDAHNLVPGDTNQTRDVFVHDRGTGRTERVSVASDGTQAVSDSFTPSVSGDGRVVAFGSWADNLAPGDTSRGAIDLFVHNRVTGRTEQVNVASDGTQAAGESYFPSVSGDGRLVAFLSEADNLVPGDTNKYGDVFVAEQAASACTIIGTADADLLIGTAAEDVICGLGGNDRLVGLGGDDRLLGGAGDDRLQGDAGDDRLHGGPGDDWLSAGPGDDMARGGRGDDDVRGGTGHDRLRGGAGDDVVYGDDGDDRLFGHHGDDLLHGSRGNDFHHGGQGTDICNGAADTDRAVHCERLLNIP